MSGPPLISANIYKTHDNKFDLSVNHKGTLVTRENSSQVVSIRQAVYCNGLLLCVLEDTDNMLVVWNPYLCKRRWIKCPKYRWTNMFAFGYDKSSCDSYKILMACTNHYKIYELSSNTNSWREISATHGRPDEPYHSVFDVSLKGDLYWCSEYGIERDVYLVSFDFTREKFGPRLSMPYDSSFKYDLSLSSVREEQLGALIKRRDTFVIEVWVTNKIEPDAVSWRNLFKFDMMQLSVSIASSTTSFIVEEKKTAVLFGEYNRMLETCIIGENGYYKKMDLRKYIGIQLHPFVCSYVPTSVQIN